MQCPIIEDEETTEQKECLRHTCQWFSTGQCALVTIAFALQDIADKIRNN